MSTEFTSEEAYVARMYSGALLNPRIDSTFKGMLTQPTPESRAAMKSFLEAATERSIKAFKLEPNDVPVAFDGQRGVSFDIQCTFEDGQVANVEMMAFDQTYDYGKRAEYQVARLETTYLQKGDGWEKAPTVYQITVLDFVYKPKQHENKAIDAHYAKPSGESPTEAVSRYAMRTKDGRDLSNTLNIIFVELPKAAALEKSIAQNTQLENWAVFLRDADNPEKQDVIEKLTHKEAGLMQAQKSLSSISANRSLWIAQYRQEMRERDYRSGLTASHAKGKAEGLAEGIAEGRAEGIAEGRAEGARNKALETASNLLQMGLPAAQIAQATGLSVAEVAAMA